MSGLGTTLVFKITEQNQKAIDFILCDLTDRDSTNYTHITPEKMDLQYCEWYQASKHALGESFQSVVVQMSKPQRKQKSIDTD